MLDVHIENVGDMAFIECEGRIVQSEAAFAIRNAVMSQERANVIVLDLSDVDAIAGGGLGMLVFLQRWSYDHRIRIKMFNPSLSVQDQLEHASSISRFEIATLDEVIALMAQAESRVALASPQYSR